MDVVLAHTSIFGCTLAHDSFCHLRAGMQIQNRQKFAIGWCSLQWVDTVVKQAVDTIVVPIGEQVSDGMADVSFHGICTYSKSLCNINIESFGYGA